MASVGLAPQPAYAQARSASADEADIEFRLGNEAYVGGRFDEALSHYFASNRLVPNRNVIYNIARCYENLGRYVEAYRYYRSYRDGVEAEEERAQVTEALQRIEAQVGVIDIKTQPPGATIYLNRRDLGSHGTSPVAVPVSPGEFRIFVEREGWDTVELGPLSVGAGERIAHEVTMVRREGLVQLSGRPAQVTVSLAGEDGQALMVPGSLSVPVGPQILLVEAPGFEPLRLAVDVLEGESVTAEFVLRQQTGTLVVTSTENNSAVLVDGELMGFTPVVLPNIFVGEHLVSVRQEGFESHDVLVDVEAHGRLEVAAELATATEVAAASRSAESVRDAPASVSLVSGREIEALAYTGTADAIQGLRGFFYTNDQGYRLIGIRGYGPSGQFGNRTLVQLDGHTINDSWVEASYHQFEVLSDLYGLDRIEVVRGPNSLLYGSGAFQGVINMVSPAPDDPYRASRVGATALSDGVMRAYGHLRHPFTDGGLQISAGVVGGQGRDFMSRARLGSEDHPTGLAENMGDFDALTLRGNAKWRGVSFYSYWHQRDQQIATGAYETIFGDPRTRQHDRRGYADLRFDHDINEAVNVHTRAYYDFYGFDGNFPYALDQGGLLQDRFRGHWGGLDVRVTLRPFTGTRLTTGIEGVRHFVHKATGSDEEDGQFFESSNPFWKTAVQTTLRQDFGPRFGLLAGARYDLWLFDSLPTEVEGVEEARQIGNINPRFVIMGRPLETGTLKVMLSRGFRAPSVYELTYNDGGITQIASPGLEPETIYSGEVEYTQEIGEGFELVGAVFVNQIGTRIEQSGSGVEDDPLQFQNSEESLWTSGAEIELRRSFLRGWMMSAHYGWQRTREGEHTVLWQASPAIANSPEHLAAFKFVAPISYPSLQIANRLVFESPRIDREGNQTSPAVLWDLVFSGQVASVPMRYAAGVRNLLDWRYDHPVGDEILDVTIRQPGRTFVVDLSAQF